MVPIISHLYHPPRLCATRAIARRTVDRSSVVAAAVAVAVAVEADQMGCWLRIRFSGRVPRYSDGSLIQREYLRVG